MGISKTFGPLPLWGWAIAIAGGFLAFKLLSSGHTPLQQGTGVGANANVDTPSGGAANAAGGGSGGAGDPLVTVALAGSSLNPPSTTVGSTPVGSTPVVKAAPVGNSYYSSNWNPPPNTQAPLTTSQQWANYYATAPK